MCDARHRVPALAAELERAVQRLSLSEDQREGIEALTHGIVNKLLHAPLTRLRREAEREEGMAYLEVARVLFGLDEEAEAPNAESSRFDEPDGE